MLKAAYRNQPDVELARQIALNLMQCKWQDAGTWILAVLSSDPENAEMHAMMADYLRRAGRSEVAKTYEENARRLSSQAADAP